ncbi:hypothetical protein EVAR_88812_1 [Eumeta japonica]|uniref:MADF domain-containing protein n=1 Tax=Eumeta variegata TaxID=151549 RepID=A0A4C1YGC4_EUMVA|nr:hypothetical protein EVAR_88812_1 [Eumeta japonica]
MKTVVNIVNFIRARELNHRKFKSMLQELKRQTRTTAATATATTKASRMRPMLNDIYMYQRARCSYGHMAAAATLLSYGQAAADGSLRPCTSLQKKWRNIKDSYNREKRRINGAKSGAAAARKTAYVNYNQLSFLNCNTPPTNTQSNITSSAEIEEISQEPQIQTGPYETRVLAKKRKSQEIVGQELIKVLKNSAELREKPRIRPISRRR